MCLVSGLRHLPLPAVIAAVLAGCSPGSPTEPRAPQVVQSVPPKSRPQPSRSAESLALERRFASVETDLVSRGLMRTDGGGSDAPFDARLLTDNFVRIALFDEYVPVSGRLIARETSSRLRRWEDPVRLSVVFGDSVTTAQREADRQQVRDLAGQLSRVSGHDIGLVPGSSGNFTVLVVDEDERRAMADRLDAFVPGITREVRRAIVDMPPSTFCLAIAFSADERPYVYRRAIAVIRAEHPPLLRQSCFHEEITQGLGLANDSPQARPSIFNDDEEFALLTKQDLMMLEILYDNRLSPGMSGAEAVPIVREIAQELLPDRSAERHPTVLAMTNQEHR